ncbi:protein phosphatase 1 regulatory subunit 26 [Choloepus didactylus]|uniref:protein phosphatase 1 regulatory subunit 26 n=1 Tax=Choloepus didactylus TaxID=27675 RepID=UPI00189E5AF2|nr:protein phosphatase 1 regulatory subunit 26 [Choloepus didactylus]XP_037653183.1 protein phosphatase 1 regulatory subunit 26 [Choloepus didactylus]XP_037653184.1 protein phosphatase 1 regulatory subunit 26 [Choloepus didactylus]
MFLMKAPPVVALQSTWEAFGPSGDFRLPGEGAANAAVSAQVQMILGKLRGDEAAWGMSDGCAAQRSPRAERCRDARLAAHPTVLSERPPFAACAFAAGVDPTEEEEAADFGPLVLDSDSDDSVDRDIEEAIQEYLKAKSSAAQPLPGGAQPSGAAEGGSRCRAESPPGSATPSPGPAAPGAGAASGGVPGGHTGAGDRRGSASPVSVSSEDSFERSIQAEIEQFLNKKKQHESQKCEVSLDRNPDPSETPAKPACKANREPSAKVHRQELLSACKEFVFRKPPRVTRASAQPRGPKSKVTSELENSGTSKPVALEPPTACQTLEAAQAKAGVSKSVGGGRRGPWAQSTALGPEASDSSSDDGIEEAIQLYQLEKTRKEAGGELPHRAQPCEDRGPSPASLSTSSSMRSALPEPHRKAPTRRKQIPTKAMGPDPGGLHSDRAPRPQKDTTVPTPPVNAAAKSESAERSSCRVDTSTELMCAEAILDISKTILPAPGAGGDRPLSTGMLPCAPEVPSHPDGDSSSVDSDDSIEQEIRTFLALKASTDSRPQSRESPPSSPRPNHQAGGPKAPVSTTPDSSLSCKRKHRGGGQAVRPSTPKKTKEAACESVQHADLWQGKVLPGQGGWDAPGQSREGRARGQAVRLMDEHAVPDTRGGVSQGHGKVDEVRVVDEKESSDDKSSSLDSDEDLDTAIKDLLSSKRKLKKRWKEPRAGGKKRVRFSTTETQFLDKLGGFQKDWKDKSPHLLKSCLSKSKKDSRENVRKPLNFLTSGAERRKPDAAGNEQVPLAFRLRKKAAEGNWFSPKMENQSPASSPISLSDDSSSVDSDDSIELEIRKFLAEKAKESMNSSEIQGGGPTTLGSGLPPRPELLGRKELTPVLGAQPGVCTRSQRRRAAPQPAGEGLRGPERAGSQSAASVFSQGGKVATRAEHASLPTALAKCDPAPPRGTSGTMSAKGSPASRKNDYDNRNQGPRGLEPTAAEKAFGLLPSCSKAVAEAESTRPFQASCRSPSLLTQSPGAEGAGHPLLSGQPQVDPAVPWTDFAQQSRLPSTWALNTEGRHPAWKGGLGSEREKGADGQARGSPSLVMDPKKSLPFAGFSPLLSTQLFHFGKSFPWGGKQAGLFSSPLSLPLQGPSFSTFRETPTGPSPVFGGSHLLMKKEGGSWADRQTQAGLGFHSRRNSAAEENLLDLRHGRRVPNRGEEDQEALGSDASEFSDTSVEEGGGAVVTGRVLTL